MNITLSIIWPVNEIENVSMLGLDAVIIKVDHVKKDMTSVKHDSTSNGCKLKKNIDTYQCMQGIKQRY